MIVYSVRVEIKPQIFEDYIKYLVEKHINDVLSTNCFYNFELKLLLNNLSDDKIIYIDYFCENEFILDNYLNNYAQKLREDVKLKFGDNFVATRQIFKLI
jgi:predicted transport protein